VRWAAWWFRRPPDEEGRSFLRLLQRTACTLSLTDEGARIPTPSARILGEVDETDDAASRTTISIG
jgi:hypothetical protein